MLQLILCINDDYDTYYKYDQKSIWGKPLFIDQEKKNYDSFFSMIILKKMKILLLILEMLLLEKLLNLKNLLIYIIKTDPLKAIEDEYYFLNKIDEAEKKLLFYKK